MGSEHNTKTIPQTLHSPGSFRGNSDYLVNLLHNLDEWFRWYSLLKWPKFCRYNVDDNDGDKTKSKGHVFASV